MGLLVMAILLAYMQTADGHFKARYHVVVDTDGGIDDFIAICMMLASPEIEVMAITAVDGVLSPEETASRVRALLQRFGHEGIPVGVGAGKWDVTEQLPGAVALITSSVDMEEMPVDIVALGPLTNLAEVIRSRPGFPGQIRRLYWYSNGEDLNDPNEQMDRAAVETVLSSNIPRTRVHSGAILKSTGKAAGKAGGTAVGMVVGPDLPVLLSGPISRYSHAVRKLIPDNSNRVNEIAASPGDASVPLYMLFPEHFTTGNETGEPGSQARQDVSLKPGTDTRGLIGEVLESDREDKSILFSRFPVDPDLFEPDVAAIAGDVIARHGLKEWKIVVLTNEFHEHLGAYSLMGAKMGLRAREYFHVGIDELTISSLAGSTPPVSCMNDGLQASTGATLGHGTITLAEGEVLPAARFTFKDRTVELTLRFDVRDRIRKEVAFGVHTFGLETPEYWSYIRELSLKYWLELSRFDIFEIREL